MLWLVIVELVVQLLFSWSDFNARILWMHVGNVIVKFEKLKIFKLIINLSDLIGISQT